MLRQVLAVDIASVCCVLVTVSLVRSTDFMFYHSSAVCF